MDFEQVNDWMSGVNMLLAQLLFCLGFFQGEVVCVVAGVFLMLNAIYWQREEPNV